MGTSILVFLIRYRGSNCYFDLSTPHALLRKHVFYFDIFLDPRQYQIERDRVMTRADADKK